MRFRTCPAVKKYKDFGGELTLHGIRLFSVGQADLFSSTLRILLPAAEITNVSSPEEANVRISVSHAFSPQSEYCLMRITDTGVEIHCRDNAGARNAAAVAAQLASPVPGGFTLPGCRLPRHDAGKLRPRVDAHGAPDAPYPRNGACPHERAAIPFYGAQRLHGPA